MNHHTKIEVTCPFCGSKLDVDSHSGRVVQTSSKEVHELDLAHASQLLERAAARRDSLFRQSMAEEKLKPELLERKFEEALKRGQGNAPERPLRDIDLD